MVCQVLRSAGEDTANTCLAAAQGLTYQTCLPWSLTEVCLPWVTCLVQTTLLQDIWARRATVPDTAISPGMPPLSSKLVI